MENAIQCKHFVVELKLLYAKVLITITNKNLQSHILNRPKVNLLILADDNSNFQYTN